MLRIATILHPTDFSAVAEHAFHLAYSLARDHASRLIVLHVAELPIVAPGGVLTPPLPGGPRQALVEQLHKIQPADPGVPIEHRLEEGNPAAEILRVAEETGCDLIVTGSYGLTGLRRLLMGSVAEQVVRKAKCPVLVVKMPLAEQSAA